MNTWKWIGNKTVFIETWIRNLIASKSLRFMWFFFNDLCIICIKSNRIMLRWSLIVEPLCSTAILGQSSGRLISPVSAGVASVSQRNVTGHQDTCAAPVAALWPLHPVPECCLCPLSLTSALIWSGMIYDLVPGDLTHWPMPQGRPQSVRVCDTWYTRAGPRWVDTGHNESNILQY